MTAPTVRPTAVPHAGEPDLLPSDVEDSLRESLRDLLAARCPADKVIRVYDGDTSVQAPLWQAVAADLGLAALLVPEELGGAGASAREAAVVLEELGRAAAPVPFLTSAVIATTPCSPAPAPPGRARRWRPCSVASRRGSPPRRCWSRSRPHRSPTRRR